MAGVVIVAVVNPWVAAAVALVFLVFAVSLALVLVRFARRGMKRLGWGRPRGTMADAGEPRATPTEGRDVT